MYAAYARTDNQVLSPRSKMLSLGITAVEPVPLRFRPLANTSDYFSSQHAPAPGAHNEPLSVDHYGPTTGYSTTVGDQQLSAPSPDELRTQLTDFQKMIIAEQLSGNYKHDAVSPERAQTLARGLDYENTMGHTDRQRAINSKYSEYAQKLDHDRSATIEQTRRKFVRNIDEDAAKLEGLVIGKQLDKESSFRAKREQQLAYQQQLQSDMKAKPIAGDRRPVERRLASPGSTQTNLMDRIGDRSTADGLSESEHRRREAQRILATNRDDVLVRLTEGRSPENQKLRQAAMYNRNDEAVKFEEAPYKGIGAGSDGGKERKKAMQEQYLAQLLADNGPPAPGRAPRRAEDAEYSNRTGWTGLNVGGHSSDEANRSDAYAEKHLKQAAYKRLLDQQKMIHDDLQRAEALRYK